MKKFTLAQLEVMPTIESGHFDNLKVKTENERVWLSRMTVADGMPYDNQVTVEVYKNGNWKTIKEYQAK